MPFVTPEGFIRQVATEHRRALLALADLAARMDRTSRRELRSDGLYRAVAAKPRA